MFQARKEDSFELRIAGGHGPSRGLDAPCTLRFHYRKAAAPKSSLAFKTARIAGHAFPSSVYCEEINPS
jgi:hypothetical protein